MTEHSSVLQGVSGVWGDRLQKPPWLHYPRSVTLASKAVGFAPYIRVVSYSDEKVLAHQMWKEAVIDTESSIAVLLARHVGSSIDNVGTILHVEDRSEWRKQNSKQLITTGIFEGKHKGKMIILWSGQEASRSSCFFAQ